MGMRVKYEILANEAFSDLLLSALATEIQSGFSYFD